MNSSSIELIDAKALAMHLLSSPTLEGSYSCVILDDLTIERQNFFVFFYDSSRYLETGDYEDRLFGNAPIVVEKSGRTYFASIEQLREIGVDI